MTVMTDVQALAYAMKMEQEGAKYYSNFAEKCHTSNTKSLFQALAKMEVEHYNILEAQYKSLSNGGAWLSMDLTPFETPENILKRNSEVLKVTALESDLSDLTVLRMAYLMENDLATFYKGWAKKVENPSAQEFLMKLGHWEDEHYNMLYAEYRLMVEENWNEMGFAPF